MGIKIAELKHINLHPKYAAEVEVLNKLSTAMAQLVARNDHIVLELALSSNARADKVSAGLEVVEGKDSGLDRSDIDRLNDERQRISSRTTILRRAIEEQRHRVTAAESEASVEAARSVIDDYMLLVNNVNDAFVALHAANRAVLAAKIQFEQRANYRDSILPYGEVLPEQVEHAFGRIVFNNNDFMREQLARAAAIRASDPQAARTPSKPPTPGTRQPTRAAQDAEPALE